MRADMGKVLVERPRVGHSDRRAAKGYRKRAAKALAAGGGPAREGMKARTPRSKFFNEHLGPLRRFLDANVGRPWDKVYSEIAAHVDRGNVVQKHVLTHLFDYVITAVEEVDGEPFDARPRRRQSLRTSDRPHVWYVCPRTGLLRKPRLVARSPWRKPRPDPPRRVKVSDAAVCLELDGRWELVTLAELPETPWAVPRFDVVLNRRVGPGCDNHTPHVLYGIRAYAVARRVLSRREIKQLPVPIDWVSGPRTAPPRAEPQRVR
jgi:hypothetical protein